MPKLVLESTGAEVIIGSKYLDFDGEPWIVSGFRAPTHAGSTGRVYVYKEGTDRIDTEREFFPGVMGMKIVEG